MRVLVFTPFGPRLEPETVSAVQKLTWDGDKVTIFRHETPTGHMRNDILSQYRAGRKDFLAGGFDALMVIESDVIPPADTLEKLTALDADWAAGVYVYRHGSAVLNIQELYPGRPRNQGESLTHRPAALRKALRDVRTGCSGGGLGCTLIKRNVLQDIDFRLGETADCDHWLTRDVWAAGYSMKADMSVTCGHKKPDGEILWPEYAQISV